MNSMTVHASAVSVQNRGCLIVGAGGTGKSTLALEMIAAGATLIADDQTAVTRAGPALKLSAPTPIAGQIEIRGIGLLQLVHTSATLGLIVDLDRKSFSRLPAKRYRHLLGVACPIIFGRGRNGLAAILDLILRNGIETPT